MTRKIETIADDSTLLQEIVQQQDWIDELAKKVDEKNDELKTMKQELKDAENRLVGMIRDKSERPLFGGDE